MYDIFTYIYHEFKPNVGKYTIHGAYGEHKLEIFRSLKPNLPSRKPAVLNRFNGTWTSLTKNLFRWNWINPWLCSRGQIKGFCWKDSWCFYSPPVKWELLDFMLVAISSSFSLSFSFASSSFASTARSHVQCSLPLNCDHLSPVFPAGPQPRDRMPKQNVRRYVRKNARQNARRCRKECQKKCQSERMQGDVPEGMSKCQTILYVRRYVRKNVKQSARKTVRYVRKNVRKCVRKYIRQNARRYARMNVRKSVRTDVRQNDRRYVSKNMRKTVRQYVRKNVRQNARKIVKQYARKIVRRYVSRHVRKNVRRYARKNVRRYVKKTVRKTVRR